MDYPQFRTSKPPKKYLDEHIAAATIGLLRDEGAPNVGYTRLCG